MDAGAATLVDLLGMLTLQGWARILPHSVVQRGNWRVACCLTHPIKLCCTMTGRTPPEGGPRLLGSVSDYGTLAGVRTAGLRHAKRTNSELLPCCSCTGSRRDGAPAAVGGRRAPWLLEARPVRRSCGTWCPGAARGLARQAHLLRTPQVPLKRTPSECNTDPWCADVCQANTLCTGIERQPFLQGLQEHGPMTASSCKGHRLV